MSVEPRRVEALVRPDPTVSPFQNSAPYSPDPDEISLIDAWLVLRGNHRYFWAAFLACLMLGVLSIFVIPAKYESFAVIRIGQLGSLGLIEQPNALAARLQQLYRIDDVSEAPKELPYLTSVQVAKGKQQDPSFVTFYAVGETPQQSSRYLADVLKSVLTEHQSLYTHGTANRRSELTSLNLQMEKYQESLELIENQIAADKQSTAAGAVDISTLIQEKTSLASEMLAVKKTILNLELELNPLKTAPTEIIRTPTVPLNPTQPKPKLYLAVALMVGIFAGLAAVFLVEFFRRVREISAQRGKSAV